jgi:hypothetical protein
LRRAIRQGCYWEAGERTVDFVGRPFAPGEPFQWLVTADRPMTNAEGAAFREWGGPVIRGFRDETGPVP